MPSPRVPDSPAHCEPPAVCLPQSDKRPRFRAYGSGVQIPAPSDVQPFASPLSDLLLQSHLVNALRGNLQRDARLCGVAEGIALHSEVFLSQLVDEVIRSLGRDIDDAATNTCQTPGVARIDHIDGNPRIAPHIAHLLPALGRVDQDVLAVGIHPDLRDLW